VKISVVVPNYNGAALLNDCLGSIAKQEAAAFEVILVDDGSSDDSVRIAREIDPAVTITALGRNRGFAAASNAGIAAARQDLIFLLNNDTELAPDCLSELLAAAERNPKAGMIAPKILNYYQRDLIDSVSGMLITLDCVANGRGRGEIDRLQYDDAAVLFPSACAAVYRRAMLEEIGLFDDHFFAYCEDTDLGLRARRAGWQAVGAPAARVYHKYSQTIGSGSARKLYLIERNRIAAALRNYPLPLLLLLPFVSVYRYLLMLFAAATGRGRGQAVKESGGASLALALVRGCLASLLSAPRNVAARSASRLKTGEIVKLIWRHRLPIRRLIFTP
jgi:GT2 family glycosyltransferase